MQWICLHNLAIRDEKRHFQRLSSYNIYVLPTTEQYTVNEDNSCERTTNNWHFPSLILLIRWTSNHTNKKKNGHSKNKRRDTVIRTWEVILVITFVPDYRGRVDMFFEDATIETALWFDDRSTDVSKVYSDDQSAGVSQSPEGQAASESKLTTWMACWK